MAASYSVALTCRICGTTLTVTNALEVAGAKFDAAKPNRYPVCPRCRAPMNFKFASITAIHSGNVGSHTGIVQTISDGTVSSATN